MTTEQWDWIAVVLIFIIGLIVGLRLAYLTIKALKEDE